MNRLMLLLAPIMLLAGCAAHQQPATVGGAPSAQNAAVPASLPQSQKPEDLRITEQLRRAIIADPAVSTKGRNIIIYTNNGLVCLRGAVEGMEDERRILEKTVDIKGLKGVDDQLETHVQRAGNEGTNPH